MPLDTGAPPQALRRQLPPEVGAWNKEEVVSDLGPGRRQAEPPAAREERGAAIIIIR